MLVELNSKELESIGGGFWWLLFPIGAYFVYEAVQDYLKDPDQ